jgi:DNA-binding transcriptional ArsR family regulator
MKRFDQIAPDIDDVHRWAAVCLAPTRLEILVDLGVHGESAVGDIATRLELDRSSVSHALAALREADLVRVRTDGRRRLYHVGPAFGFERTEPGFVITLRRSDGYQITLTRRSGAL